MKTTRKSLYTLIQSLSSGELDATGLINQLKNWKSGDLVSLLKQFGYTVGELPVGGHEHSATTCGDDLVAVE